MRCGVQPLFAGCFQMRNTKAICFYRRNSRWIFWRRRSRKMKANCHNIMFPTTTSRLSTRGFLILCRSTLSTGKERINADTVVLVFLAAKLYVPSAAQHFVPDRGIPLPTIIQYGSAVTAILP